MIQNIRWKNITQIISEIGGYISVFFIILYMLTTVNTLKNYERYSVKLVDPGNQSPEIEKETLNLIKKRVSVEGLFQLYDEIDDIKMKAMMESDKLKKAVEFNKNQLEKSMNSRLMTESTSRI